MEAEFTYSETVEFNRPSSRMQLLRSVARVFWFVANIKARIKKVEPEVSSQVMTEEIEKIIFCELFKVRFLQS